MSKSRKERDGILLAIQQSQPQTKTELDYETPFQLLVAVMLSAQTTDRQVNRTTPSLFARVRTPEDMLRLTPEELEHLVRSVNYFRTKARHIYATARILADEHSGTVPNDLRALRSLPGIGVKTAKVVLGVLYDAPYIGVDTHVHRVMNRIGIVQTTTPEQTDRALDVLLTDDQKRTLHHALVLFGRYVCMARTPRCVACPVSSQCAYYRDVIRKLKK